MKGEGCLEDDVQMYFTMDEIHIRWNSLFLAELILSSKERAK
jgi:hypothetical protein